MTRTSSHREPPVLQLPAPRRRYVGLLVSLLLHGAVIALAIRQDAEPWARTRAPGILGLERGGGGGGGGGGNRIAYIALPPAPSASAPAAAPAPAPVPVEPPQVIEPPKPEPEPVVPTPPVPAPPVVRVDSLPPSSVATVTPGRGIGSNAGEGPGSGTGTGGGRGSGTGTGVGSGTGPGTGGGGGTITEPEWYHGTLPMFSAPKQLRGTQLAVTFWVAADGRVARVAIEPEIADRKYREKFEALMLEFRFKPGRAPDGRAVPATVTHHFTLPTS